MDKTKVMRISRDKFPVQIMIDQKQMENAEYLNYFGSIIKIMQDTQVKLNQGSILQKQHLTG